MKYLTNLDKGYHTFIVLLPLHIIITETVVYIKNPDMPD